MILALYYAGMSLSIKEMKTNLTLREGEIQSLVVPERERVRYGHAWGLFGELGGRGGGDNGYGRVSVAGDVAILAVGLVICKWKDGAVCWIHQ